VLQSQNGQLTRSTGISTIISSVQSIQIITTNTINTPEQLPRSLFATIMHFSNAALLSILTLTTSTMAAPQAALEPALAPETLVARSEVSETEIVWLGLQECLS
jgi:hypothetical protein